MKITGFQAMVMPAKPVSSDALSSGLHGPVMGPYSVPSTEIYSAVCMLFGAEGSLVETVEIPGAFTTYAAASEAAAAYGRARVGTEK
jgi:hypothetical protein